MRYFFFDKYKLHEFTGTKALSTALAAILNFSRNFGFFSMSIVFKMLLSSFERLFWLSSTLYGMHETIV